MFYKPNNVWIKVSDFMLKKKLLCLVIKLTVTLSPSYVCCGMTISLLCILGKLPSHCLIKENQTLKYCLKTWPGKV